MEREPEIDAPATRRVVVLLDHENQGADPRIVVTQVASTLTLGRIVAVKIRAYGGWFSEAETTESRMNAVAFYQEYCPVVMENGGSVVKVSFEFADELAAGQRSALRIPITHTLGVRRSPGEIVTRSTAIECQQQGCKLPELRKWTKKRTACPLPHCAHRFETFFQRREQKQVDVHMAADLLFFAAQCEADQCVALATDDLDLIPAVLQSRLQNPSATIVLVRSAERGGTHHDATLERLGVMIVTLPRRTS